MNESDRRHEKLDEQRILTFRATTIDSSDEHEPAFDVMRVNLDSESKVIDECETQNENTMN
jgi:hypothetical protein